MRRSLRFAFPVAIASLFVPDLSAQQFMGRQEHYFPQMVVGGGSASEFVLYNPSPDPLTVRVELRNADGSLLSRSQVDLPGGGTQVVTVGEGIATLRVGWARLTAAKPFEVTEFFQIQVGEEALPRVGVLSSTPSTRLRVFCFQGEGVRTGVAIANPEDIEVGLTIRRFDETGNQLEKKTAALGARQQLAKFLDESPFFAGMQQCSGSVEIEAKAPLVGVTLRTDDNLLAAAPVMVLEELPEGSVGTDQLIDGAVTGPKLDELAVTSEKIAANAVTSAKILNGTIAAEDLANGAVPQGKLSVLGTPSSGMVLGTDGSRLGWQRDGIVLPTMIGYQGNDVGLLLYSSTGNPLAVSSAPSGMTWFLNTALSVFASRSNDDAITAQSENGYGVKSKSVQGDSILTTASAPGKAGIYATSSNVVSGYAGYFVGRVHVQGTISTSGVKPFKIDHPLDPENRYLMHAAVESDEVLNTYSGNVVLDLRGEAVVGLPEWFETLNTDFRYSLTAVGTPGPGLYVAEEVTGNHFRIAGGTPGGKVSWQITARRNDPGMQLRPFHTEVEKTGEERGTYLDPEAYGQPPEKSYDRVREGSGTAGGSPPVHSEVVPPPVHLIQPE